MDERIEREALALAAAVLKCPVEALAPDTAVGSIPQWDSIAHVGLFLAIEEKIGRRLRAEEVAEIRTIRSIAALLERPAEIR